MWEIEFKFINEFGEEFKVYRKVEKDWESLTEVEFLHDTYKNFLNNYGYPVDYNEEIEFVKEDANDTCVCNINLTTENLKEHSKEIANLVAKEFNETRSKVGFNPTIMA